MLCCGSLHLWKIYAGDDVVDASVPNDEDIFFLLMRFIMVTVIMQTADRNDDIHDSAADPHIPVRQSVSVGGGPCPWMADRLLSLNRVCRTCILMPQQTFEAVQVPHSSLPSNPA